MQRMLSYHLKRVVDESASMNGLFLVKVRQLSPVDFALEFSQKQNLFFSLNNQAPFVALNVDLDRFPGGGEGRTFATDLRHFLTGRLTGINLVENDAILRLDFTRRNNLLESETISLIIELIPNHPQAILINPDNVILSAYRYSKMGQGERLIQKGEVYMTPRHHEHRNPQINTIHSFYEDYLEENKDLIFKENYAPLFRHLNTTIKKLTKLVNNYKEDLQKLSKMPILYRHASLLLAEKPAIYGQTVQIGDEIIEVDPSLNAIQNADQLFKKAKKLKKSEAILNSLISEVETRINDLEKIQEQVKLQPPHDDIMAIYETLGLLKTKRKKEVVAKLNPYFIDYKNTRILFGKNTQQNDYLTHKLARKSDTFMHIKNVPGAHIIISGSEPQKDVLEFAGQLALYLSKKVDGEVSHVLVKTIKKGPFPGQVILRNEKTIYLRFNRDFETIFRNQIKRIK